MKTIQIQIDCTDEYCHKCIFSDEMEALCEWFNVDIKWHENGNDILRCKECINAEVKDDKG